MRGDFRISLTSYGLVATAQKTGTKKRLIIKFFKTSLGLDDKSDHFQNLIGRSLDNF